SARQAMATISLSTTALLSRRFRRRSSHDLCDAYTAHKSIEHINRETVMKTIMRNGSLKALLFAGTTAVLGVYAAGAEAGFTIISDGTITTGTDGAGLFGTPG